MLNNVSYGTNIKKQQNLSFLKHELKYSKIFFFHGHTRFFKCKLGEKRNILFWPNVFDWVTWTSKKFILNKFKES